MSKVCHGVREQLSVFMNCIWSIKHNRTDSSVPNPKRRQHTMIQWRCHEQDAIQTAKKANMYLFFAFSSGYNVTKIIELDQAVSYSQVYTVRFLRPTV